MLTLASLTLLGVKVWILAALVAGAFAVFALVGWAAFAAEARSWNGGVCPRHQKPWQSFDCDSQGGRLYNCACKEQQCYTAASWPVDSPCPLRSMAKLTALMFVVSVVICAWALCFVQGMQH